MGDSSDRRSLTRLAIVGLAAGALFGLAGTFVESAALRQLLWTIDGIGLVVAAASLTIRYLQKDDELLAAGFLVFGIGEGVIVSGNDAGLEGSVPSFGGGVALWSAALLMILIPARFDTWVRIVGLAAATLFAIVAVRIALGEQVLPITRPLPFFGYPFLVLTFIGWIVALRKDEPGAGSADVS